VRDTVTIKILGQEYKVLVAMVMLHMADDVAQARSELETFKSAITDKVDHLIEHIERATK
jgi:cell division protein ZapA (FtsZ GTPase activity inhibitor)